MDRTKKQKIIVGVLALFMIMVWGAVLIPSNRGSDDRKDSSVPNGRAVDVDFLDMMSRVSGQGNFQERTKSAQAQWGRNPFILPVKTVEVVENYILNGIIWDPTSPQALINDQVVGVGDRVGLARVVDIQQNKVILNTGSENFEVKVGD